MKATHLASVVRERMTEGSMSTSLGHRGILIVLSNAQLTRTPIIFFYECLQFLLESIPNKKKKDKTRTKGNN